MPENPDRVLRAITDDGSFRVIVAVTTEMVRGVARAQRVTGETGRWLGDLVTGTTIVRETMSPGQRSQGILQTRDGRGRLVADSHPDGGARGLAQLRENTPHDAFGSGAVLQMMRTLVNGDLHRGVVAVPESGRISDALMVYFQESEQVASMVAVGSSWRDDGSDVRVAGGYIVQLLPELAEGPLMVMTERLKDFETIETLLKGPETTPESMLDELLYGMPYTRLDDTPLRFQCRCSDIRLLETLATLPTSDIEELLREGKPLEITCDYCLREYTFAPERLRGMVRKS